MKTFSQCDYVNRLERLLGLIRITICLCNYTLSSGNMGHYPTAPLDLHNISRTVSRRAAPSSCNQTPGYLYPYPFQRNAPQVCLLLLVPHEIPSVVHKSQLYSPRWLRSWPGFWDVADRSAGNSGMRSLPFLIKSVSQVSVLIWAAALRGRDWQYLVLKKKYIAHLLLRLNVIGCFRSQGCGFSVEVFFFTPKVPFSVKLNRLSEDIDIVKTKNPNHWQSC